MAGEITKVILSRPFSPACAQRRAQYQAGIILRGHSRATGRGHARGAIQQPVNMHSRQGRRHHAKIREGRIAAANVRLPRENAPEVLLLGQFFQRCPRIGNGHKILACLVALDRPDAFIKVLEETRCLGGPTRLARDHKERVGKVDGSLHGRDAGRDGGIQHVQLQKAGPGAKRGAANIRAKAAAAHTQQNLVGKARALDFLGETLEDRPIARAWSAATVSHPRALRIIF